MVYISHIYCLYLILELILNYEAYYTHTYYVFNRYIYEIRCSRKNFVRGGFGLKKKKKKKKRCLSRAPSVWLKLLE